MKVVFLDIDGVLNHWEYLKRMRASGARSRGCTTESHLDPECVGRLNGLLRRSGAKVVVSSTWRILHSIESLQETLEARGFEGGIIDFTTTADLGCRGAQIEAWLDSHDEVESFVILDDDGDLEPLCAYWVQTSLFDGGLNEEHVETAIQILSENSPIKHKESQHGK